MPSTTGTGSSTTRAPIGLMTGAVVALVVVSDEVVGGDVVGGGGVVVVAGVVVGVAGAAEDTGAANKVCVCVVATGVAVVVVDADVVADGAGAAENTRAVKAVVGNTAISDAAAHARRSCRMGASLSLVGRIIRRARPASRRAGARACRHPTTSAADASFRAARRWAVRRRRSRGSGAAWRAGGGGIRSSISSRFSEWMHLRRI